MPGGLPCTYSVAYNGLTACVTYDDTLCREQQHNRQSMLLLVCVPVCISVVVQTMHSREEQLIYSNAAILSAHSYAVLLWVRTHTPHPATSAGQGCQHRPITCAQNGFGVSAPDTDELACSHERVAVSSCHY